MTSAALCHDFDVISTAEYVPPARREAAKVLTSWGIPDLLVEDVCVIVSELITNVVRHAAAVSPTAMVSLAVEHGSQLVLTVADTHPHMPNPSSAPHELGGRGLLLVHALVAEHRGSHQAVRDSATGGKQIVVRFPLARIPA